MRVALILVSCVAWVAMFSACATKLEDPPAQAETVKDAFPETTEVPEEWSAPAGDMDDVDDGWLGSFNDPQLASLVEEALSYQNPNMRLLAARVDRAVAQARLAGAALKPTVSLGADLSGTGGDAAVSGGSSAVGVVASWEWDVWGRVQAGHATGVGSDPEREFKQGESLKVENRRRSELVF